MESSSTEQRSLKGLIDLRPVFARFCIFQESRNFIREVNSKHLARLLNFVELSLYKGFVFLLLMRNNLKRNRFSVSTRQPRQNVLTLPTHSLWNFSFFSPSLEPVPSSKFIFGFVLSEWDHDWRRSSFCNFVCAIYGKRIGEIVDHMSSKSLFTNLSFFSHLSPYVSSL